MHARRDLLTQNGSKHKLNGTAMWIAHEPAEESPLKEEEREKMKQIRWHGWEATEPTAARLLVLQNCV